ncbi:FepA family TonB-dependent siderophore receptor [Pasteurellaceae bacterium LIM206]|nr:FepA family TonB-dependent siderophore receptor [Pasteurellaceae bacterium LIM206]
MNETKFFTPKLSLITLALFSVFSVGSYAVESLDTINVSAADEVTESEQTLGKSVISAKELSKAPVVNDVSEVLRLQPGLSYDSGSANGQYGNKRQIDIRNMGPDNTLILIDGKPATSRNASRYGRNGARNTNGDTQWVPVDEIESIEVIRGTEAARYGSGAMGGVVNIRTKPVTEKLRGSLSYSLNVPESSRFGTTNKATFDLSGSIVKDVLGFRLYGSWQKTRADVPNLNQNADGTWTYAGREGTRNKDIGGRLAWNITPNQTLTLDASYSRHGNIYTGDSESNSANASEVSLANQKAETTRIYRQVYSLTHEGKWSWGSNKTYVMYDKTINSHLPVYLGFSNEGHLTGTGLNFVSSKLDNFRFNNELTIPFRWHADHVVTVGMEYVHSRLSDPSSMNYSTGAGTNFNLGTLPWLTGEGITSTNEAGVFVEDAINFGQGTVVTPMLRFDWHSVSGPNWSPSLNISHDINEHWMIKGGLARAYKAPNLYQINPNYVLANRQNNCPVNGLSLADVGSCYTVGNPNLKPETSFNKEIGFEYHNDGYKFGLTYFHNAYRNKIEAETDVLTQVYNPDHAKARVTNQYTSVYQWGNVSRATVQGIESFLNLPLIADKLNFNTNFTYFIESKNKETGNPLNYSPKYTLSNTLNWQINEQVDFSTTYKFFGKQFTRSNPIVYMDYARGVTRYKQGAYGLWDMSVGYRWNDNFSIRAGISNILDKKIYVNGRGSTYNQVGRAYYTTLKYSF